MQTHNEFDALYAQVAMSLSVYVDRDAFGASLFEDRYDAAIQCLALAEYDVDDKQIQAATRWYVKGMAVWAECNECGDTFDAQDPTLRPNVHGDHRCHDCDGYYTTCNVCGIEYQDTDTCDCEPCLVCGIALRDGDADSCADCVHDCAHIYTDDEPGCVRCGHTPPAPGSHLRLILGGKK